MNDKLKNLFIRSITGTFFVAAIITSIYFQNAYKTLSALFAIFNAIGLYEFYHIVNTSSHAKVNTAYLIVCGCVLYLACFWLTFGGGGMFFILYALLFIAYIIAQIYKKSETPARDMAFAILGQLIVALPFSFINLVAVESPMDNTCWVYAMFIFIWVSDSGAYVFGSLFGKHKLIERISPNKTIEGLIGGIFCTFAAASVFAFVIFTEINWIYWFVFAAIICVTGVYGDLLESLLKRGAKIKDTGNILPGHGGVLDRFDSMLLSIPFVFIFLQIIQGNI